MCDLFLSPLPLLCFQVIPLSRPVATHVFLSTAIFFWSLVHGATHLTSFALDDTRNSSAHFGLPTLSAKLELARHLYPVITGALLFLLLVILALSSVGKFRSRARFIPFFVTHWMGTLLFYALLLTHGESYFNPSFWKWLVPAVVILVLEQVYRYTAVAWFRVRVVSAWPYSMSSQTCVLVLDRPRWFLFSPGQYILLNIPWVGKWTEHCVPVCAGVGEPCVRACVSRCWWTLCLCV